MGKSYRFLSDTLYYIPYTADFSPFCDAEDPIMHTYIDFELIPPIITDKVIFLNAKHSNNLWAAVNVFVQGGKMIGKNNRDLSNLYADPLFWELCKSSIIYLVNQITVTNEISQITDEIVLKAIDIMHTRMSEKLSIEAIARECYMIPDSFIRRFYRTVGITPHAYLKELRLRTARYLKDSGMSLAQIAFETGYSDSSSLSHALKNSKSSK
jgi:AraC-like DNA-binding protein